MSFKYASVTPVVDLTDPCLKSIPCEHQVDFSRTLETFRFCIFLFLFLFSGFLVAADLGDGLYLCSVLSIHFLRIEYILLVDH